MNYDQIIIVLEKYIAEFSIISFEDVKRQANPPISKLKQMEETRLSNHRKIETIELANSSQRAHFIRVNNKIVLLMG